MKITNTIQGKWFAFKTKLCLIVALCISAITAYSQAPQVYMAFPSNNSAFLANATITLRASASDANGTITKVEFYNGAAFLGQDTSYPYEYRWAGVAAGNYQFSAKATDNSGLSTTATIALTFHPASLISNKKYYVRAGASESNNGLSATTPFNTIQKAANIVNPGDTVFVMNGTYTNPGRAVINIIRTGTPNHYIVFTNYPGHKPFIQFDSWSGIGISNGGNYIEVSGFKVQGNNNNITEPQAINQPGSCANPNKPAEAKYNGTGINIEGRPGASAAHVHHHRIRNNEVLDCGAGGIISLETDYITIENNTVHRNGWYSIFGGSGISLLHSWNFDNTTTGYRCIVRNNITYANKLLVPWVEKCQITDGNGIIIDSNLNNDVDLDEYTGRTLVTNNVSFNNGGSGMHAFQCVNVDIINNTSYHNSISAFPDGELYANFSKNCNVLNNIIVPLTNEPSTETYANTNVKYDYNCIFNTTKRLGVGANDIYLDPQFVNASIDPAVANFRLKSTSPLLNKGTTTLAPTVDFIGTVRPQGNGIDIGAYEFQEVLLPVQNIGNLVTNPTFNANTTGWTLYQYTAAASLASAAQTGYTSNVAKTTITNGGTESWNLQLKTAVPIKAGETYSIKFKANASAARTIDYTFQQSEGNKTIWNSQYGISLTTTPTTYGPYTFTCTTTDASNQFNFLLGNSTTTVYIDDVEITVIATELVTNPNFNINTTGWDLYQSAPAAATVASAAQTGYTTNVAKATITNAGTESWQLQFRQAVPLKAGETYSVKFKASAAAARTIDFMFQQDEGSKTVWNSQWGIALTTTPTTYGPYTFVCNTTDTSDIFRFLLGGNASTVYIDDVEITVTAANFTLEAESAALYQAVAAATGANGSSGNTGSGYVDYLNPSGDYIEWTANVSTSGLYTLRLRYALTAAAPRSLQINVNNVIVNSNLSFPTTTTWSDWQTVSVTTNLRSGSNTIRATATGTSGPNIDNLVIEKSVIGRMDISSEEIAENFNDKITAYPNPTKDFLNVTIYAENETDATVELMTMTSQVVSSKSQRNVKGNNTVTLDVRGLNAGLYLLNVKNGSRKTVKKIIIAK